jgi:hypothetical protein
LWRVVSLRHKLQWSAALIHLTETRTEDNIKQSRYPLLSTIGIL